MKWILGLVLFFVAHVAVAEPQHWMKQDKPDSIGLLVFVSEPCPFTQNRLRSKIEGEFLRARIKPIENPYLNLSLHVTVVCQATYNQLGTLSGYAVHSDIRYGTALNKELMLYVWPIYGSMLSGSRGDAQYFVNNITDKVSTAITDYLKANY